MMGYLDGSNRGFAGCGVARGYMGKKGFGVSKMPSSKEDSGISTNGREDDASKARALKA